MPREINITGTKGKTYDLEQISTTDTRTNSDEKLVTQVWYWSPKLPENNPHSKSNPPNPEIGQIWLSQLVDPILNPELFRSLQ